MAAKITVLAVDVWDYFQDAKSDLESHMHQIASNPEYGIDVYITENCGLPNIVVTADDTQVYEESAVNAHDCQKTVEKIYDDYLTQKAIMSILGGDEEEPTALEVEDIIDEREIELDSAVYEFVMTAVQGAYIDDDAFDDILEDCKEHFLEYLARKHCLPIYRPMMLEYEDGEEEISEYPYEDMEFDDPNNPLYKA